MRRSALPLLVMLLASVRGEAQRMVLPALPAPPAAKEALYGSISPDGRSFVYEVVEGDERLLWRLDLASLRAERLTAAPGVRYRPVWAPDGRHLAYWRSHPFSRGADGNDGIYLFDLDSQTERRVVASVDFEAGYSGDVSWLVDGRILYWHVLERPNFGGGMLRSELVAIRSDSVSTQSPPRWMRRSDAEAISPRGTQVAYIAPCCGGERQAIWVRDAGGERCMAGPIVPGGQLERPVAWTRDEKRLFLVARSIGGADSLNHAYEIDLRGARAWRIGPADRAVESVSVSDAGDVVFTALTEHGRVGSPR